MLLRGEGGGVALPIRKKLIYFLTFCLLCCQLEITNILLYTTYRHMDITLKLTVGMFTGLLQYFPKERVLSWIGQNWHDVKMECVHNVSCTAYLYYFLTFYLYNVHTNECTYRYIWQPLLTILLLFSPGGGGALNGTGIVQNGKWL